MIIIEDYLIVVLGQTEVWKLNLHTSVMELYFPVVNKETGYVAVVAASVVAVHETNSEPVFYIISMNLSFPESFIHVRSPHAQIQSNQTKSNQINPKPKTQSPNFSRNFFACGPTTCDRFDMHSIKSLRAEDYSTPDHVMIHKVPAPAGVIRVTTKAIFTEAMGFHHGKFEGFTPDYAPLYDSCTDDSRP